MATITVVVERKKRPPLQDTPFRFPQLQKRFRLRNDMLSLREDSTPPRQPALTPPPPAPSLRIRPQPPRTRPDRRPAVSARQVLASIKSLLRPRPVRLSRNQRRVAVAPGVGKRCSRSKAGGGRAEGVTAVPAAGFDCDWEWQRTLTLFTTTCIGMRNEDKPTSSPRYKPRKEAVRAVYGEESDHSSTSNKRINRLSRNKAPRRLLFYTQTPVLEPPPPPPRKTGRPTPPPRAKRNRNLERRSRPRLGAGENKSFVTINNRREEEHICFCPLAFPGEAMYTNSNISTRINKEQQESCERRDVYRARKVSVPPPGLDLTPRAMQE